jgi:pyruvate dehydrogenase E2 component (dihydrolipoamide acetyltransferase)
MTFEFKLPDIGEGVVEGEVVRWLVQEGDEVHEDQPLVEIMTDKATVEIPAPRAGRVGRRMYAEGQLCPVGKVLLTIEIDGVGSKGAASPAASATAASPAPGAAAAAAPVPATPHGGGGSSNNGSGPATVLATPATRKLARDLGVDLRGLAGSGRAGRITSDDVRDHAARAPTVSEAAAALRASTPAAPAARASVASAHAASAAGDVRVPFRGVRKKIAENLVRSQHTVAQYTYVEEVDCTDLVALRAKANERLAARGAKLSYLPFIVKATVAALQKFPQLNATLDEAAGEIVQRRAYHIGLATATENGLIVPVIRDADRRSLVELAQEIERLAEATRAGRAAREELSGSTFTITSLGALGGLMATPIVNFPEVAILGIHKIARRPAATPSREIALRDIMNLSISVDHRLVDGYDAARFVAEIKATLETPGLLFLDSV